MVLGGVVVIVIFWLVIVFVWLIVGPSVLGWVDCCVAEELVMIFVCPVSPLVVVTFDYELV